jgi:hypothetical protein
MWFCLASEVGSADYYMERQFWIDGEFLWYGEWV